MSVHSCLYFALLLLLNFHICAVTVLSKAVRFAIRGGGYIAKIHAQAVADTAGAELVAIAGRSGSASELA